MCNRSLCYTALNLDCPDGTQSVIFMDVKCIVCVSTLTLWSAAIAVEEGGGGGDGGVGVHLSALILPHHQLPSISPTGALYDVCQLITPDSI